MRLYDHGELHEWLQHQRGSVAATAVLEYTPYESPVPPMRAAAANDPRCWTMNCSRSEAMRAEPPSVRGDGRPAECIISITDPDATLAKLSAAWPADAIHRTTFYDVEGFSMNAFTPAISLMQAAALATFVRKRFAAGTVGYLVHCEAGFSRSYAVCLALRNVLGFAYTGRGGIANQLVLSRVTEALQQR